MQIQYKPNIIGYFIVGKSGYSLIYVVHFEFEFTNRDV